MSKEMIIRILKTYEPVEDKPGYVWFNRRNKTIIKESILREAYNEYFSTGNIGDKEYEDYDFVKRQI